MLKIVIIVIFMRITIVIMISGWCVCVFSLCGVWCVLCLFVWCVSGGVVCVWWCGVCLVVSCVSGGVVCVVCMCVFFCDFSVTVSQSSV